ncbi:uncharacterized protein SPSK_05097 [Sporothrix schenckii 1099-18]|uniref:Zn(2)-C6 fungal-type domain-containing protein n=1 Tax=Sporothrix schenckii 1099-18 TaxID=1397361 RepID=A0A0F2LWL2_SPOSC|nr:uncharacterized protein SPSK_05097 [Sporothrix schenckii 1099-18]KJR80286.1 hypothetical protein SPSK_05097 [Sporothrix schenckii 1099-18]
MEEDGVSSVYSTLSPTSSSLDLAQYTQQQLPSQSRVDQHLLQSQLQQAKSPQPPPQGLVPLQRPPRLVHSSSSSSTLPSASSASASGSGSSSDAVRGRSSRPPSTRRRSKLSSQERAKILEVRRQRACLRCKMLKIQCSRENPCKPCLSSAVRGYERKVLSFCYCVRTRFVDVDIFQRSEAGPPPEIPTSIRTLMDQVERPTLPPAVAESFSSASTAPASASAATHDLFEDTLLRWLTSPDHAPPDGTSSIVALLYDVVGHEDSLRAAVDDRLPADFQTFLFTTSLAHSGWRGGGDNNGSATATGTSTRTVSHRDLCIAGHVCGSRIVRRLDRVLTPQFLAKCDRTTHRALLLLVVGVILGVSYSTRLTTSPSFPHDLLGAEMRHSPTLWLAMKEHLAQMLAHHLIFLGSMLGIKLDTAAEKTIIDTAVDRWHKPERSLWAGLSPAAGGTSAAGTPTATPTPAPAPTPAPLSDDALTAHTLGARLGDFNTELDSPPAAVETRMARLSIVALSDPDLLQLQAVPPMSDDDASANPASFYNMDPSQAGPANNAHDPNNPSGPSNPNNPNDPNDSNNPNRAGNPGDGPPHTRKKRSVWIVRPYDDGGHRDPVSVFARFQLQRGQNLGLFV